MAVAGHYGAAHAAFAVLESGGNAVDAGVAAGIALGVLQSDLVNVAGVAPIMIDRADQRDVLTISGVGTWPRAVTADFFQKRHGGKIPEGILRTVIPAAPEAWITALENWGTMSFGDCAAAAIRFASAGFPMYGLMSDMIAMHAADYARWPSSAAIYLPNGQPPRRGESSSRPTSVASCSTWPIRRGRLPRKVARPGLRQRAMRSTVAISREPSSRITRPTAA